MRTAMTVLLSTTEFEFAHGHAPRGHGSWCFEFDPNYFDVYQLGLAVDAHNASTKKTRAACDLTTRRGRLLIWMHNALYRDALRATIIIVKLSAKKSIDEVVGKVCT